MPLLIKGDRDTLHHTLSTAKLLFGNPLLKDKENTIIFKEVEQFIKSTGMFRQFKQTLKRFVRDNTTSLLSLSSLLLVLSIFHSVTFFLRHTIYIVSYI